MKYTNKKKLITLFINTLLILFCTNTVFATITVPSEVKNTLTDLTKILLLIGTAVCIGKIIHIGILYLTSAAMEKSTAKQALLPWIIGTVICFGAATIGGSVIEIVQGALEEAGIKNVLDY